ncbi:MAG: 16S rRNA (uracil(1498)-N(3))-methyltransferase [Campylobacterales bacterium]|nr:16S rRNA (uracil(1498)-N(3))-methyltransferase [Campylobacterales bacterium]
MQYLYHEHAGDVSLDLQGDSHHYIFKVRRHRVDDNIALRHLKNDLIYIYRIVSMDKKQAHLELLEERSLPIKAARSLHIGWCMIDPKNIEKVLPILNEMGVAHITFISCDRSQQNFKIDFERLERILLNSSQQCGRSDKMKLELGSNLKEFIANHPEALMLNFSEKSFSDIDLAENMTFVIGCEGGFSDKEVKLFESDKIVGLDTPLILRSESAVCAVASKVLV